jgi:hypothetical protein
MRTETALLKEKDQPYVVLAPPPIILTRCLVKLSAVVFARVWAVSTTYKTDARAKNFDNFERIFVFIGLARLGMIANKKRRLSM